MKTERITLRPWPDTDAKALYNNPASGRVMEKCGFKDTGEINWCSHLYHGEDRPVHIMKSEPILNSHNKAEYEPAHTAEHILNRTTPRR